MISNILSAILFNNFRKIISRPVVVGLLKNEGNVTIKDNEGLFLLMLYVVLDYDFEQVILCLQFLINFLFLHLMTSLQNLWKIIFISSKKFFLFSRYSSFCNFFLPFHTFQIQKDNWKRNNLCHELTCINLQM